MKADFKITIAVCLFTSCATACTQLRPLHRTALRYDGLYSSSEGPNQNDYLRFYPDGIVVGTDVIGTRFKTIQDWLRKGRGCAQGHYRLSGSMLTFSTAEPLVEAGASIVVELQGMPCSYTGHTSQRNSAVTKCFTFFRSVHNRRNREFIGLHPFFCRVWMLHE